MRVFKFLSETETTPVEYGGKQFELRELSGGQIEDFRKLAVAGVKFDDEGKPTNFASTAIETETRLVGAALFEAGLSASVGVEYAKTIRTRVLKELAKEARRLNGMAQPGDDPEADKKSEEEKKLSTQSKETGTA